MKRITLYLLLLVVCLACSEDSDKDNLLHKEGFDNLLIVGEWVTANPSETCFTDIIFSENNRVEMLLVKDSIGRDGLYQEDYGSWNKSNNLLSFTMLNNIIPQHEILKLSNDYLQLRNIKYNSLDNYFRVVETLEMDAGHESSIYFIKKQDSDYVSEFFSGNPAVATVSSEGVVRANQGGITFIGIKVANDTYYVKVKVRSRIEVYSEEAQMKFSEIKKKMGEPDESSEMTDYKVYFYFTHLADYDIYIVEYIVDEDSDSIVRVQTLYSKADAVKSDWKYINKYYYPIKSTVKFGAGLFGKYEYRNQNSILFYPYNDADGYAWIAYDNYEYFVTNN